MITNPMPQRMLRGHRPARTAPRTAATAQHLAGLAGRLTPRDRWLVRMLFEHRVLTSHQIAELAWPSIRAANLRLLSLYRWRVLDRFQPFLTTGSAPMHYVLDVAGAAVLAGEEGTDPKTLGYRHDRTVAIAHSLRQAHTVGVNGFFTALVAHARRPETTGRLTAWWSEARCIRHFGDLVRPDAYGRWTESGRQVEWFLEYDFGTEPLTTLADKLAGYERLSAASGITTPVLVWLPSARRETGARRALAEALRHLDQPNLVPVATTSADVVNDLTQRLNPAAPRWASVTAPSDTPRVALSGITPASTPPADTSQSGAAKGTGAMAAPPPMPPHQPADCVA